jgi:hypothetical protein
LDFFREGAIRGFHSADVGRHGNQPAIVARKILIPFQDVFDVRRIQPPFGDQAVGGQAGMQVAAGDSVTVGDESPGDRTEADEIEIRVAHFERIESPFNQANSILQRIVALKELQAAADALILIGGEDAGHMGMQKGLSGVIPDQRKGESDEVFSIESAQNLPAGMLGHDEDCGWDGNLLAPNRALEFDAFFKFGQRFTMTNLDARRD